MIILDFIGLFLLKKNILIVSMHYAKVSYLSAGILSNKSAFSPVIDVFEK